jgi:hypothetical protein
MWLLRDGVALQVCVARLTLWPGLSTVTARALRTEIYRDRRSVLPPSSGSVPVFYFFVFMKCCLLVRFITGKRVQKNGESLELLK